MAAADSDDTVACRSAAEGVVRVACQLPSFLCRVLRALRSRGSPAAPRQRIVGRSGSHVDTDLPVEAISTASRLAAAGFAEAAAAATSPAAAKEAQEAEASGDEACEGGPPEEAVKPKGKARSGGVTDERARARKSWETYQKFLAEPGHKCPRCWLMLRHCCCRGLPKGVVLRPKVTVLFHHLELGKHLGSNTAKLLLHFGAELCAWGIDEHDARLRQILMQDPAGTVVLFPTPKAVAASELRPGRGSAAPVRRILVLDGGWRECKRMNDAIRPEIRRCVVSTARREEFGGTRKYGNPADAEGRVQTAAAFACMLQEMGEDPKHVEALKEGLAHFMECWETQICRSKTWVS